MKNSNHMQNEGNGGPARRDSGRTEPSTESGRAPEAARNAERRSDFGRREADRGDQPGRSRSTSEDLFLHDDDEAELELPR
jgi:hypothetical protein